MPISPENRKRYPPYWRQLSHIIRFVFQSGKCAWCDARHGAPHPVTGSKVVLTTAHIHDMRPEADRLDNLRGLCQRCHNRHDASHRRETRRAKPADRALLVTMLRSFGGDIEGEIKRRNRVESDRLDREFQSRVDRAVERRTREIEATAKKRQHIDEWLNEQGFAEWCSDDEIKAAVRIARHARVGADGMYGGGGLPGLQKKLEAMAQRMAEVMAEHGVEA